MNRLWHSEEETIFPSMSDASPVPKLLLITPGQTKTKTKILPGQTTTTTTETIVLQTTKKNLLGQTKIKLFFRRFGESCDDESLELRHPWPSM